MSHLSLFNNPLLLGFEQMERTLARVAGAGNGYPPYNIEQIGSSGARASGSRSRSPGSRPTIFRFVWRPTNS